jgi:uroporphyrin-III C-methyltransferase/precorrin-2 dehydrogenase/sirohydrochlorin ferrochelatase
MQYLPIFLDVRHKPCLVVGGGEVAVRKVANLLRAGAAVTLVSPELAEPLRQTLAEGALVYRGRAFEDADLDGALLVVAATADRTVNRRVAELAGARGIPVNVVDQGEDSTFIMPSVIDRSPVVVAISTGTASPVLARLLRTRLESVIPAGYGRLGELCARYRDRVKARFADQRDRRRFWDRVLQGGVAERIFSGHVDEADAAMEVELNAASPSAGMGEVYLVGAGPGDPDLLTFRALRLMQQADVVVYDRLVAKPILEMTGATPGASMWARNGTTMPCVRRRSTACWQTWPRRGIGSCASRGVTPSSSAAAGRRSTPWRRRGSPSRWSPASQPHRAAPPTRASR